MQRTQPFSSISRFPIAAIASAAGAITAATRAITATAWRTPDHRAFDMPGLGVGPPLRCRCRFALFRRLATGTGRRGLGCIGGNGCDRRGGSRSCRRRARLGCDDIRQRLRGIRPVAQPFFELPRRRSEVAIGILGEECTKAGRRVRYDRIVPGHHPAMTVKPFASLLAERRLRVKADKGFVGFIGPVGHDDFVGGLDRLALQFGAPFLDRALGNDQPRRGRLSLRRGNEFEILGQRRAVPGRLPAAGCLVDGNTNMLERIFERRRLFLIAASNAVA
jgi:hypothetical protein